MAGHPPHLTVERTGSTLVVSFNECPSVSFAEVRQAFQMLVEENVVPARSRTELEDGRIVIHFEIPRSVPLDGRTRVYREWSERQLLIVHTMNTTIQARQIGKVTERVLRAV